MRLIILDRDGVINQDSTKFVKSADEIIMLENSLEAIANLTQIGYKIVICTNQSGLGRGLFDMAALNDMHEKIHRLVRQNGGEIAAIFMCPHTPDDNCSCRKPKTGMILSICERFSIDDISQIIMVGDSERDLQAIHSAGGIPFLVKTGNGKKTLAKGKIPPNTMVFEDLLAVSEYLINKEEQRNHAN